MSEVKRFETKGVRTLRQCGGAVVSCPNIAKYITCVGQWLNNTMLTTHLTGEVGGYYDGADVSIDDGGTNKYLLTGSASLQPNETTPFVIRGGEVKFNFRNNHTSVACVTFFRVKPRTAVGDVNSDGVALKEGNCWADHIAQGIADKIPSVATNGQVMIHSTDHGSGGIDYVNSIMGGMVNAETYEVSIYPTLTLYDSSLFCELFRVVEQHTFVLKPGDEAFLTFKMPRVEMMDGTEPYKDTGLLYFDFTELFLCQVQGKIGHVTGFTAGSDWGLEAAASASTNRRAGRKQRGFAVMPAGCFVDMWWSYEMQLEIFDADLVKPAIGMRIDADIDANEYNSSVIQVTHDLQT